MQFEIEVSKSSAKFYKICDSKLAKRLNETFLKIQNSPFVGPNIKKMKGDYSDSYRLRLGDLRIVYSVDLHQKKIYVELIGYRGDVY